MVKITSQQWRDLHEATKYPFAENATLTNGQSTFLYSTFIDAHLYPVGGGEKLYVRGVDVALDQVTVRIGDLRGERCFGVFEPGSSQNNVVLTDSYGRPAGILVSDAVRLTHFVSWGIGSHTFEPAMTEFAAVCCTPTPEVGVRGIRLQDGSLFTGPVTIVGGDGVVVRRERQTATGQPVLVDPSADPYDLDEGVSQYDIIRVDIVGDPLFKRRLCGPLDLFDAVSPIQKIIVTHDGDIVAECYPDSHGNISIQRNDEAAAHSAIRVHPTEAGLMFEVVGDSVLKS